MLEVSDALLGLNLSQIPNFNNSVVSSWYDKRFFSIPTSYIKDKPYEIIDKLPDSINV